MSYLFSGVYILLSFEPHLFLIGLSVPLQTCFAIVMLLFLLILHHFHLKLIIIYKKLLAMLKVQTQILRNKGFNSQATEILERET